LLHSLSQTRNSLSQAKNRLSQTRSSVRKELRQIRRSLSEEQQAQTSKNIISQLYRLPLFQKAQHIASYQSFDGEVDISSLIEDESKTWFMPITSDACRSWERKRLIFQAEVKDAPFLINRYGIKEPLPNPKQELKPSMLDIVLLPLVGFDRLGNRLGMGKGYYDRTFGGNNCLWRRPLLIGLAHGEQECKSLVSQSWDIPLDMIVTGNETIDCRG